MSQNNTTKEEESQEENTGKTDKELSKEEKPWQFQEGDDPRRNLNGRPKGTKNFSTQFKEAVKVLAEDEGKEVDDMMLDIFKTAYNQAKKGNFNYFRDLMDRVYGKPVQKIDSRQEIQQVSVVKFVDGMRKIADESE